MGEPLALSRYAPGLAHLPAEARRPQMKALAAHLLERISAAIPVTPVPLCCRLLIDRPGATTADLSRAAAAALRDLQRRGVFVARGAGVPAPAADTNIEGLDEEIAAGEADEAAAALVERGLRLMRRRGICREVGGRWEIADAGLAGYYAAGVPERGQAP